MKSLFFIFLVTFSFLGKADEITIAVENKPWEPYYTGKGKFDSKKPGVWVELLKRVEKNLKSENIKIKYKRLPWKRCLSSLKSNYVEAVLGASFKKSRMEVGEYPMNLGQVNDTMGVTNSTYFFTN